MRLPARRALAAAVVAGLVGVLLGACSPSPTDREPPAAKPQVEFGFTQLLPDEGTRRALLRVVNVSRSDLDVTEAGLDWAGYGAFTSPQDATLVPGRTLDLRVRLPVPDCASPEAADDPVRGIVRTADSEVVQRLEPSGQVFVRRLYESWCADRFLAERVGIEYADDWRILPGERDGEPAAVGSLTITRRDGSDPVEVVATDGTVLYDLGVRTPARMPPSRNQVDVRTAILPGYRCDEHARGQATAPWTLAIIVRIGTGSDARRARVLVEPPARVRNLATRALDQACALRARG